MNKVSTMRRQGEDKERDGEGDDLSSRPLLKRKDGTMSWKKLNASFTSDDAEMLGKSMVPLVGSVSALCLLPVLLGQNRGGTIIGDALSKAFRGGVPGFFAAIVQIASLMWLRTLMNYQIKTGKSWREAVEILYKEGGVARFYSGLVPALALVPLSRFGDVAANAGVLSLLGGSSWIPIALQTAAASAAAAGWRAVLMPLNVLKTNMQANGRDAMPMIRRHVEKEGAYSVFFKGTVATIVATWAGHYPWFATANQLDSMLAVPAKKNVLLSLLRNAFIGCVASAVSDIVSNSIRVVNAYRQVHPDDLTYSEAVQRILEEGGPRALFLRGLSVKVFANMLNSIVFNVLVKLWTGA
eukprot:g3146.t1